MSTRRDADACSKEVIGGREGDWRRYSAEQRESRAASVECRSNRFRAVLVAPASSMLSASNGRSHVAAAAAVATAAQLRFALCQAATNENRHSSIRCFLPSLLPSLCTPSHIRCTPFISHSFCIPPPLSALPLHCWLHFTHSSCAVRSDCSQLRSEQQTQECPNNCSASAPPHVTPLRHASLSSHSCCLVDMQTGQSEQNELAAHFSQRNSSFQLQPQRMPCTC